VTVRKASEFGKGAQNILEDDQEHEQESDHEGEEEHADGFGQNERLVSGTLKGLKLEMGLGENG
jgi:hypothetical protein